MSNAGPSGGQKRKANQPPAASSSNARKRQKFQDARSISTQTADAALTRSGELNIASFIKTREFEISALDRSMKKARQNLSARAFQQVPRHMRRRTASHNAKKVPRRLRGRAQQEASRQMNEDNTPLVNSKTRQPTSRLRLRLETAKAIKKLTQKRKTVRQRKREAKLNAEQEDPSKHVEIARVPRVKKNKLAEPPLATSKFKRRQVSKSWLPTHMWHAKRAHMTKPTEPLWRMAIPLQPTEKTYRATHRASQSRGCIAWDMSYMSTVGCLGTATAIEGMLKALRFHGHGWIGSKYNKWKGGSRSAKGWICCRETGCALGVIDVLWRAVESKEQVSTDDKTADAVDVVTADGSEKSRSRKTKLDRRIMIRIHPSAFHQFWLELLKAAKAQKPQVLIEDLRFEIGSIQITGPCSTEALFQTLSVSEADDETSKLWTSLALLSNPALLPSGAILHAKILDPRFTNFTNLAVKQSATSDADLHETIVDWPLDSVVKSPALFSHKTRCLASNLTSQWLLNRRRQKLQPGESLEPCEKDPEIPVILLAHRPDITETTQQGSWTILAPWRCVDLLWRKLMSCPLLSGSKPKFGGLHQVQQIAFEQISPWFPGDFPGTEAGKAWERTQATERFNAWLRRPPSRRIAWQSLDLGLGRRGEHGRGWTCDWEYLFVDSRKASQCQKPVSETTKVMQSGKVSASQPQLTQRQRKAAKSKTMATSTAADQERNTSSSESDTEIKPDVVYEPSFIHLSPSIAKSLMQPLRSTALPSAPALVSVRITLLTKGTPAVAARIYRLPAPNDSSSKTKLLNKSHGKKADTETSNTTPPAAQASQPERPIASCGLFKNSTLDLRAQWLSLDPRLNFETSMGKLKKTKTNHRELPARAEHHDMESLRHINVLPKNAPPEIHEQYGRKPLSKEEEELIAEKKLAVHVEEQKLWDTHVPCPDAEDLIGFVTSGGYNLSPGRGTAVGGIWMQRVLDGWIADDYNNVSRATPQTSAPPVGKMQPRNKPGKDRERHLCIVRNAGESVGRLGIWELYV